ncbi:hypothetical protein EV426DRAFT_195837 [Tirmania nivea]|nr:hypothetical protein EV426DRAFT_195837 [Tirmania nivea]
MVYKGISARRYIASRGISAGRHIHHGIDGISILENLVKNYPEPAFLNLFRMHRTSFWTLVETITPMWPAEHTAKKKPRPIYQQLAVALYVLRSAGGGGLERSRIALNISKGAISTYLWHSLWVLSKLLPTYVKWPSLQERTKSAQDRNIGGCQNPKLCWVSRWVNYYFA